MELNTHSPFAAFHVPKQVDLRIDRYLRTQAGRSTRPLTLVDSKYIMLSAILQRCAEY